MQKISIVWLKRDLRLSDHEALSEAISAGFPVLILYCFEPSLISAPQSDERHWRFVWESLQDMHSRLKSLNSSIAIVHAEVLDTFRFLQSQFQIQGVYSHQETGIKITFDRDKEMSRFFRANGIAWYEFSQQGVQRGRKNRDRWRNSWFGFASAPICNPDWNKAKWLELSPDFWMDFSQNEIPEVWKIPNLSMQPGGESKGKMYLRSFLEDRVRNYSSSISKPELSRKGCSRLSPYLAWDVSP